MMLFVNPLFLTAAVLIGFPIVLHLWMRQKPKKIMFPAMRFVMAKEKSQKRTLLLKHLFLLLLRVFLILLLVLIFARPSLRLSGGIVGGEAPTAAILLFDTSPRMEYRYENVTRLEASREIATKLLGRFPRESRIAVVSTRPGIRGFVPDRAEAQRQISRLETVGTGNSLAQTLQEVLPLFEKTELPRREVYIFTDMSAGAWREAGLREVMKKYADVAVYVIDVRAERVRNDALDVPTFPDSRYAAGGTFRIAARVLAQDESATDETKQKNVAVYVLDAEGVPQKRGESSVFIKPGESAEVEFRVGGLMPGPNQGFLQLDTADALACDDTRYFTVEVTPPTPILLVAPKPAEEYAFFIKQALSPAMMEREGRSRFLCDVLSQEEFIEDAVSLDAYRAVMLIDPHELPGGVWQRIHDQVSAGKGFAVFLGPNAKNTEAFNGAEAQQLLPAKLEFQARRPEGVALAATATAQHPVMRDLTASGASVPWERMPAFRYWQLGDRNPGAQPILQFIGGDPAVIGRSVGAGRVLCMTTPPGDTRQSAWNHFAHSGTWVFVVLMNRMAEWLAGDSEQSPNIPVGTPFSLPAFSSADVSPDSRYTLSPFPKTSESIAFSAEPRESVLDIPGVERPGNYRLTPSSESSLVRGFSANTLPVQTDLTKITPDDLQNIFGEHPLRMAKNISQIERQVFTGRMGMDMFTPLVILFLTLMIMEIWLSNRFYRK